MAQPRQIDALDCQSCRSLDRLCKGPPRCKVTGDAITQWADVEPCLGANYEPIGPGRPAYCYGRKDAG